MAQQFPLLGTYLKEKKTVHTKKLCQCFIIPNCQKAETTQMSINWMNKICLKHQGEDEKWGSMESNLKRWSDHVLTGPVMVSSHAPGYKFTIF